MATIVSDGLYMVTPPYGARRRFCCPLCGMFRSGVTSTLHLVDERKVSAWTLAVVVTAHINHSCRIILAP